MDLAKLPSPFYRVSLKGVVLNSANEILLIKATDGNWEIPGGGWEYGESSYECLTREFKEELGVDVETMGDLMFAYKGRNPKGYMVVYLAFPVSISDTDFKLEPNKMSEYRFVDKAEFMQLPFDEDEAQAKEHVDQIWSVVE